MFKLGLARLILKSQPIGWEHLTDYCEVFFCVKSRAKAAYLSFTFILHRGDCGFYIESVYYSQAASNAELENGVVKNDRSKHVT